MTTGHPLKLLLEFSYPMVLGHAMQQLYSIVDGAIVGRLIGWQAFAAVGVAQVLHWLVLSFILGVTQGFGILFSHRLGTKDMVGLRKGIAMAVLLCGIFAVVLTTGALWLTRPVLQLLNTPADIFQDTAIYLTILFSGITITITYNLLAAILRALGDSKAPVKAMVFASLINIVLDIIVIKVFGMGIAAVAFTTLIAQLLACAYCCGRLAGVNSIIPHGSDWRIEHKTIQALLRHGTPLVVRNAVVGVGGLVIQYVINSFGTLFVAGVAVAKKFLGLMEVIGEALEGATATYVGQNYSAKKFNRIRQGVSYAIRTAIISAVAIALIIALFGRQLAALLVSGNVADLSHIVYIAYEHLVIMGLGLPALYLMFIWRAALQGVRDTYTPRISGFVELVLRVAAILLLPRVTGELGVAIGECVGWIGGAILVGIVYARVRKQQAAQVQQGMDNI